jgi:hypothetical protein
MDSRMISTIEMSTVTPSKTLSDERQSVHGGDSTSSTRRMISGWLRVTQGDQRMVRCNTWRPGSRAYTCDTWRVTCDTWRMSCDTCRMSCDTWRSASHGLVTFRNPGSRRAARTLAEADGEDLERCLEEEDCGEGNVERLEDLMLFSRPILCSHKRPIKLTHAGVHKQTTSAKRRMQP